MEYKYLAYLVYAITNICVFTRFSVTVIKYKII